MTPILSLCIPTYNRSSFLREALLAIAAQWENAFEHQVEIVVSDNASTDNTLEVLNQIAVDYDAMTIKVYQSSENNGPDANIYHAVQMAQGQFVYILSDDDVLLPGAVKKMVDLVERYPTLDGFCLNIKSFLHSPDEAAPVWFAVEQDKIVTSRNDAFDLLRPAFLSVIAFRRSLIVDCDYTTRIGTNLLQSYLFLDVMVHEQGLYVTAEPFLAQRRANTSGWNYYPVMATGLGEWMAQARCMGFSRVVLSNVLADHLKGNVFNSTLSFKLSGAGVGLAPEYGSYLDGAWRLLKVYGLSPFLLFVVIPLMLAPAPLLQQMCRVYKKLRSSRDETLMMPRNAEHLP